jgi:hypothetical protein
MNRKERSLLIINSLIIGVMIIMRLMVFGYIFFVLGLFVILPIVILHTISSTKGFMIFSRLPEKGKVIIFTSVVLFIIFILFQYEIDDMRGYMIIEAFIRHYFVGYNSLKDHSTLSFTISIISGLLLIIADIYIIRQTKKIRNIEKLKNDSPKKM